MFHVSKVLSDEEAEIVNHTPNGPTAQARRLVEFMFKKTDDQLLKFIQCLRDASHDVVVSLLEGEGQHITVTS